MTFERWRGWAVVGALLAAVAVAGCDSKSSGDDDDDDDDSSSSPSCSSICKDIDNAACPESNADCVSGCTQVLNISTSAGCTAEYDTYIDCIDGVADKCELASSSTPPCQPEIQDLAACITPYCTDHPTECE